MSASQRRKGATFERTIAAYLRGLGIPSERTSRGVHQDGGDLTNPLGLHLECKSVARLDLAGFIDQATRDTTDGRTPVVIIKRRGTTDPAKSYAVLELGQLLALLGVTDR